jgi:hypothetical protein
MNVLKYLFCVYSVQTGEVTQVVEYLPCKHEALSSNPSTVKNKEKPKDVFTLYNDTILTRKKWIISSQSDCNKHFVLFKIIYQFDEKSFGLAYHIKSS